MHSTTLSLASQGALEIPAELSEATDALGPAPVHLNQNLQWWSTAGMDIF